MRGRGERERGDMWLVKAQLVVLRWAHLVSMAEHRQETSLLVAMMGTIEGVDT